MQVVRVELTMRGPKARRLPLAYTHIVWLAPKELNFVYTLIRRALKTVEDRAKIYFGGKGWTWTIGAQSFNLALYQLSYPPVAPDVRVERITNWFGASP